MPKAALHNLGCKVNAYETEAMKQQLAERGYDPAYGARPLRRLIQQAIGDQLAKKLLAGDIVDGDTVHVDVADGGAHLELAARTA